MKMYCRTFIFIIFSITFASANLFSFSKIVHYAKYIYPGNLTAGAVGNELWTGILKDCSKKMSFSCIQKNAYTYLDDTLIDRNNITVFDGLVLRKNNIFYESCSKDCRNDEVLSDNLVDKPLNEGRSQMNRKFEDTLYEEQKTPLEEITEALRDRTIKFLATRDYEIQLPEVFFGSSNIKISPREIDEEGALVRIDFGNKKLASQGRFFKKIRKFIQNRLMMSFFALLLIIKLIKVKFMFVIPFLFGVGTAKKIFLKLLLFMIPAFAHVFKLCSSYYSSHSKSHHHHHHQIAHHHHHVPVPVPVPTYLDHPHHPPPQLHHEEEFEGYDYAHPHLQIRKDMEELKEWGIDAFSEPIEDPSLGSVGPPPPGPPPPIGPISGPLPQMGPFPGPNPQAGLINQPHFPPAPVYSPNYANSQYSTISKPNQLPFGDKLPTHIPSPGQALAYNGYFDEQKLNRRASGQNPVEIFPQGQVQAGSNPLKQASISVSPPMYKSSSAASNPVFVQPTATVQTQRVNQQIAPKSTGSSLGQANNQVVHDDTFYGPILEKLEDIFAQLGFNEEACREGLICSMYKNPTLYSPHSNLLSNELSRDPKELRRGGNVSASSQRFHRYVSAARIGQDGGDCLRTYPC